MLVACSLAPLLLAADARAAGSERWLPDAEGRISTWALWSEGEAPPPGWPLGAPSEPPAEGGRWVWRAQPGPLFRIDRLPREERPRGEGPARLELQLHVRHPVAGWALVGARGPARLWLDGAELDPVAGQSAVLEDDQAIPLRLSAGVHLLQAEVARRRGSWGLALRLVDAEMLPLPIELAPPAGAAEATGAPLPLRLSLEAQSRSAGIEVTLRAAWGPRPAGTPLPRAPLRLRLSAGPGAAPAAAGLELALAPEATPGGAPLLALLAGLPAGQHGVTATLHDAQGRALAQAQRKVWHWPRAAEALERAARALREAAQGVAPVASRWAVQARVEELGERLAAGESEGEWLQTEAEAVRRDGLQLARGGDPIGERRGALLRAYRSPLDGSLQRYALYVPPGYSPRYPLPLVVGLHGLSASPRLCLRQLFGQDLAPGETREDAERAPLELPKVPALVVCPGGFGNTAFRFAGEQDVLATVAQVRSLYRVDPRRISVTGASMGGIATFALATRFPGLFSSAAALCGQSDVRLYGEIERKPLAPWEPWFLARQSALDWADNGVNLPFLVVHGLQDATPLRQSEAFVRRYEELKYEVEFRTPDLGHNVWAETYAEARQLDLLRRKARPARPRRVILRSFDDRHRHADWLSIERFGQRPPRARVEGRVLDAKGLRLRLRTEGVLGLRLHLGDPGFARRGRVELSIDGQPLSLRAGRDAGLCRRGRTGPWEPCAGPEPPSTEKRPGLSGPLDDLRYGPLLFVWGSADPAQREVNRRRAEEDAASQWGAPMQYPVKSDLQVSAADRQRYHLVLYGNPRSNRELARVAERLPIRFDERGFSVGERRYDAPDQGVAFVAPNPDAPGRYVAVYAGNTWVGTLVSHHLPRYLPDYLVFDRGIAGQRDLRILQGRPVLEGGFFDERWRVPAAPTLDAAGAEGH